MSSLTAPEPPAPPGRDDRDTRLAWVCLAAAPLVFVFCAVARVAFVNLVIGADESGTGGEVPVILGVLPSVVGLSLFLLPAVLATWFGRRARRQGDKRAKVPVVLVWLLTGGVVVLMFGMVLALTNLSDTL